MAGAWTRGATAASVVGAAAVVVALLPSVLSPAAAVAPNLLTANQASVETDLTGLGHGYYAETITRTTARALDGAASASLVATSKSGMALRTVPRPAVPGASYSASAVVRTASGSQQVLVQLRFWTASGAALGAWNGAWTTAGSSTWTRAVRAAAVAPSTAATMSLYVVVQSSAVGATAYVDELGLWQSSTVPAWTIPGATATATPTSTSAATTTTSAAPAPTTTSPAPAPTTSSAAPTTSSAAPAPSTPSPAPAGGPVNLLTVNEADVESSTLGFEPAYGGMSLARATDASVNGASSLGVTSTSSATFAVRTARTWTPVTSGLPYAAALSVRPGPEVAAGRRVLVQVRTYDDTGTQVSVANGPWTTVVPGAWTRLSVVSTPPAPSTRISVLLVVETAAVGETYRADTWGLWQSATVPAWNLPTPGAATVALFLGDSYTAGAGASTTSRRWTSLLATKRGWLEANYARGGTGYLKTATTNGCGLTYCPTFTEMAAEAVAAAPDLVVVAGGRNDLTLVTTDPTAVHRAVLDTFALLRAGLPSARIYAVTPMWDATTPPAVLQTLRSWVLEAAAAQGVTVVDGAETWLVGHPEWITADNVHPDDAGYAVLAQRIDAGVG